MITLAERLKIARVEKRLTQTELAEKAGLSQGAISNIEKSIRTDPHCLPKLAKALDVSYDWLLEGAGDMRSVEVTYDDDLSALRSVYLAIAPARRTEALHAATTAMISFLSQHTS